ncbi:PREDICTED: lactation elevated protein 1 [Cyprinodon variegatus]|uniref:lactation elevated protein 1 n=1 Tax=Cyprinodon variegatus TaxID=28743 RepID=UPI0007425832|nr:PREDICTED: lactation elevated protein 1 [Cyprinodon variegatus]
MASFMVPAAVRSSVMFLSTKRPQLVKKIFLLSRSCTTGGVSDSGDIVGHFERLVQRGSLTTDAQQRYVLQRLAVLQQNLKTYSNSFDLNTQQRTDHVSDQTVKLQLYSAQSVVTAVDAGIHRRKQSLPKRRLGKMFTYDPISPVAMEISREISLLCFDEFQVRKCIADIVLRGDHQIRTGSLVVLFSPVGSVLLLPDMKAGGGKHCSSAVVITRFGSWLQTGGVQAVGLHLRNCLKLCSKPVWWWWPPLTDPPTEYCHTVCLDSGTDYRRLDRPGAGKLYYLSGEPGAEAYLDTLFEEMSIRQRSVIGPRVLTVLGRDVILQKTCGSIADCTFDELCGKPMGASDYLEMARIFDTVFIRHVPILTLTLKDQARRFTTLIDNFYDKKVRVVLLAAAPLDRLFVHTGGEDERDRQLLDDLGLTDDAAERLTLFTAEEEIFAFQRTISRLMEMQTETYWVEGDRSYSSRHLNS